MSSFNEPAAGVIDAHTWSKLLVSALVAYRDFLETMSRPWPNARSLSPARLSPPLPPFFSLSFTVTSIFRCWNFHRVRDKLVVESMSSMWKLWHWSFRIWLKIYFLIEKHSWDDTVFFLFRWKATSLDTFANKSSRT